MGARDVIPGVDHCRAEHECRRGITLDCCRQVVEVEEKSGIWQFLSDKNHIGSISKVKFED